MRHKLTKKTIIRLIVIAAIIVIPVLYSYFYLGAFWDPYSRLDTLPVAVVNSDEGATINGEERNVGQEMCDELKESADLKFVFTDEESAKAGTEGTDYYAMIVIPENFSADIASAGTTDKHTATITYSANEKQNYLASQILGRVVLQVEESIRGTVDSEIVAQLADTIKEVPDQMMELQDGLCQLQEGSDQLKEGTSSLAEGTQTFRDKFIQYQSGVSDLKEGSATLTTGAASLDGGIGELLEVAQQLSAGCENLPQLKEALAALLTGLSQAKSGSVALAEGSKALSAGLSTVNDATTQLADAATDIAVGASAASAGTAELSEGIDTAKSGVTTAITDTKDQLDTLDGLSEYAKAPVTIETDAVNAVPNYGTAFAPYFMSLSLWVGALIMFVGIYMDSEGKFKILSSASEHKLARSFIYLLIGFAQAIVLALILQYSLGLEVENPLLYYSSCCLVSMVFIAIVQLLMVHLKDLGKFLSIVLLILQLTSCGGTFPMETVPKIFNVLYPFMPMTYSVGLFKEAISGSVSGDAAYNAVVLFIILVAFMALTIMISSMKAKKDSKIRKAETVEA